MGYTRKKTAKIAFAAGHEFAGLEVRMQTVGIGKLLKLLPVIDKLDTIGDIAGSATPEQVKEVEEALFEISKIFHSWNIEDDAPDGSKTPVPCTYEELLALDPRLVTAVMQAWAERLAGVPDPLDEPSSSGGPSLEASIPMDVSSPSPTS